LRNANDARNSAAMQTVGDDLEWRVSPAPVPSGEALAEMEARAAAVIAGEAREMIWLLEHPPVYTAGTSADPAELIDPRFPVHKSGRGGRYTYHGPGQRIGYLILDLRKRRRDARGYVHAVENWLVAALARHDIAAFATPDRIGVWTRAGGTEAKIAAIGVRIRKWVTLHGFSVNLDPNLDDFSGIVPCGIADFPVTSAARLGKSISPEQLDSALRATFLPFLDSLGKNEA
jgi:lipoyl(octanoyl) transferase